MLLIPRNNFASAERPTPLNVEWSGPGWPDLVVWTPSLDGAGGNESGLFQQLPRRIDRPQDLYWTVDQAQVEIHYGQSPGELWVYLDTQTPAFATFQVNFDDTRWDDYPGLASFRWRLVPGPNNLKVRVKNAAGAVGPASSISIQYLPSAH
jgi:hypothetical protein